MWDRFVGRDAIHPRVQLAFPFEWINIPEDFDKNILQNIIGIIMRLHYVPDMPIQPLFVESNQFSKCSVFTGTSREPLH